MEFSKYIAVLEKVELETGRKFEEELYNLSSYNASLDIYEDSFFHEETDLSYVEWLEEFTTHGIIFG